MFLKTNSLNEKKIIGELSKNKKEFSLCIIKLGTSFG